MKKIFSIKEKRRIKNLQKSNYEKQSKDKNPSFSRVEVFEKIWLLQVVVQSRVPGSCPLPLTIGFRKPSFPSPRGASWVCLCGVCL